MNEPRCSPHQPFGSDADEALNALLDGELAAFAEERGLTEEAARAQLEAWPDYAARLSGLEQIRGAVQAPIPPLDDVTRRRLVRGAVDAGPERAATPRRSRSWAAITAVAAAGLLVVAGIGVAISSTGGNDDSRSAKSAAAPLQGDVGNLGDVTSAAALRALLDRRPTPAGGGASGEVR